MDLKQLWPVPLYAWILPVVPVLTVFDSNADRIPLGTFLATAAGFVAAYLAIRALALWVTKNHSLTDPLLAIGFFSATIVAKGLARPIADAGALLVFLGAVFVILKLRITPKPLNGFLSVIALALAAGPVFEAAMTPVWQNRATIKAMTKEAFPDIDIPAQQAAPKRDVYYLIFDRYARGDQLQSVYGHDNSGFLAALEARGFSVAHNAYANYQRTTHSVASSLNLDYLNALDRAPASTSGDWVPLYDLLQDFRLQRIMKSLGYATHYAGAWWEPTRTNGFADASHVYRAWPELTRVTFENSAFGRMAERLGLAHLDPLAIQCERSKWQFQKLKEIGAEDGPQFVFAHFLVPHPPFVLDETGQCMSVARAKSRTRAENYIGQLKWTNKEILAFVDELIARPGEKPIIVIQSDEGPWPKRYAGDEITRLGQDTSKVKWTEVGSAELREKMAILNAIYLPGGKGEAFRDDASPVNTFRMVLREYFGFELADLPVRQYVYQDDQNLYRFHDVTGKLAEPLGSPAHDPAGPVSLNASPSPASSTQ